VSQQERNLSCNSTVAGGVDDYAKLHAETTSSATRTEKYKALVNAYYDLATVFYEWGWGQCFHFAVQYPGERFKESLRRHEYYVASFLQGSDSVKGDTKPTPFKVLDVGCGIGGPMRNISAFTHTWDVTGITLNPYQVYRGNELTSRDPRPLNCRSVQGDFMKMPFESASFDGAYAIEATCHAPDRVKCFQEIYRVLKPGSVFACYEWCMTDKYQSSKPVHLSMKAQIEKGNGLPDIITTKECYKALQEAGFEVFEARDLCEDSLGRRGGQPWYAPISPNWNPLTLGFQLTWFGRLLANNFLWFLDTVGLAPKGTYQTQLFLQQGALALAQAGKEGIFTTMYLLVGRVPEKK
jgi:sterol 24-C-methyltransferase